MPTLTEVVDLDANLAQPAAPGADPNRRPAPVSSAVAPIDAEHLVAQVLADLSPQIDGLFESRLRGALAPALARAIGGLLVESRHALAQSLHQLVAEAVARALAAQPESAARVDRAASSGAPCQRDPELPR